MKQVTCWGTTVQAWSLNLTVFWYSVLSTCELIHIFCVKENPPIIIKFNLPDNQAPAYMLFIVQSKFWNISSGKRTFRLRHIKLQLKWGWWYTKQAWDIPISMYKVLIGKHVQKRYLERTNCRWEGNFIVDREGYVLSSYGLNSSASQQGH